MRQGKAKTVKIVVHEGLRQIRTTAAGIDVGASEIWVDVGVENSAEPVQRFETFTADLNRMAKWLNSCGNEPNQRLIAGVINAGSRSAFAFSRTLFFLFHDPEGPNLLIVTVLAVMLFIASVLVWRFTPATSAKKLFLAICGQVAIVTGL
jgi:hypothetical protein